MKTFGFISAGIFVVVLMVGLGLGIRYMNLKVEGWFAPREQNVKRKVFEETKSYNEGMEQQLVKYKFEYDIGDEETKKAIAGAVRHAYADYDEARLDPQLRSFLQKCKYGESVKFQLEDVNE